MSKVNKAVWLSYDLGIGGDFPGLYKWLDNHKAIECGNSIAFFYYLIDDKKLKELPQIISEDLRKTVNLRTGDRIYIIRREADGASTYIRGNFVYGKRKSNPWEGYGDSEPQGGEDGE